MDDNYVIVMGDNGPEVWDLEEFLTASPEYLEEWTDNEM